MTFTTGYRHGYHGSWPQEVTPGDAESWEALKGSRAEFRPCMDFAHDDGSQVVIMEAGSYGGDELDDSNSATLRDMIHAWIDDERNMDSIDYHLGMGNYLWVCVNPETIDPELLADMIQSREAFDEYPVLDEDDYSNRQMESWNDAVTGAIADAERATEDSEDFEPWSDEYVMALSEWLGENRYGHSEPGDVDPEWVAEAIEAVKVGPGQVTLEIESE